MSASNEHILRHIRQLVSPPAADPATDAVLLQRWIGQRDEAAFTALVVRHGPMVLQVCRRVLGNAHAAPRSILLALPSWPSAVTFCRIPRW